MNKWSGAGISLLLLLATGSLSAAQYDDVKIKTIDLGHGIYMLTGAGGNLGASSGPDGVFLIDDQFAPLTARIKTAIASFSKQSVRFVLNTHWHPDHTGGNENMGKTGAIIVAHDNVRNRLTKAQFIKAFGMKTSPYANVALPMVTFSESMALHFNGNTIKIIHVANAHTDGDSFVHFSEANVIHMGDMLFSGMYPFIDVSSGGSIQGVINGVEQALQLADEKTRFIPGHGPLIDKAGVIEYRDMLIAVQDSISRLVKEGKSLQQVLAADPVGDFDMDYGAGFLTAEKFTTFVYNDLSR